MVSRDWAVTSVLVLASALACAQSAKPETADEAAAAMERARRQAAGPLRFILEASKPRRKGTEPEAPAAASPSPSPSPPRPAGPRPAATPAVATAAAPAASAPASRPSLVVAGAAGGAAADPPVPRAASPVPAAPDVAPLASATLHSDRIQAADRATAVPALERAAAAPVELAPLPGAPVASLTNLAQPEARPKLISLVEPDVPVRVLDGLGRDATVLVDLTIRANGSVAAVAMVPPVPRQLQRFVEQALEQWRFEPLPAERVHRVELVFNSSR